MNKSHYYLLVFLLILLPLVLFSCMTPPASTPASTPAATTPAKPVVEEQPAINIPAPASKQDLPVILLTVNPATINAGGSATLSWTVTNATSVTIDHGVGAVGLTGTKSITPAVSTTYKLSASNAAGATVKTVSIIVNAATAPKK
jgi:PKD repeat protein